MTGKRLLVTTVVMAAVALAWQFLYSPEPEYWTDSELTLIKSLSLSELPTLPDDPGNQVADLPAAAELGHQLFFDTRLSGNGSIACATCHQPDNYFTDGLDLAMGTTRGPRHTPSLVGLSYSPWLYWNGRKDSQWAQALAPLEAGHEHNIDRLRLARLISDAPDLSALYVRVFADIPALDTPVTSASPLGNAEQRAAWKSLSPELQKRINSVFANLGKALAAYQRKLVPGRSAFDDYADNLSSQNRALASALLSRQAIAGIQLFVGKAQCVHCHNGPLLTNNDFHNTGVLAISGQLPGIGRYDGIREARQDPFNCLGDFSDAAASECLELRFARDENDLVGAQKTPTLRNVAATAPYMHGGQLPTLAAVMTHYNDAPVSMLSHNEAKPLGLSQAQRKQLQAFMRTLTAPMGTDSRWLRAPE